MIPRFKPTHKFRDFKLLFTFRNRKKSIDSFEVAFAKKASQKYARLFPYGRTALLAILQFLKENSADEKNQVICPSYTCVVVAHAIVEAGLIPVFVDSEISTLNLDWKCVDEAVSNRTLAVISTSLFGNPVNKKDIDLFKSLHPEIYILQDCAHSFFANDIHREGFAAFYGLNISKLISTVYGGMVTTDDSKLAAWLQKYQKDSLKKPNFAKRLSRRIYFVSSVVAFSKYFYNLTFQLKKLGILSKFVNYYKPDSIDFPLDAYMQITTFQCLLGINQIANYDADIRKRNLIAYRYFNFLQKYSSARIITYGESSTFSHFVLLIEGADDLALKLELDGIELGRIVDYDISSMLAYNNYSYFGSGISRSAPSLVLNLPVHHGMGENEISRILSSLSKHLEPIDSR